MRERERGREAGRETRVGAVFLLSSRNYRPMSQLLLGGQTHSRMRVFPSMSERARVCACVCVDITVCVERKAPLPVCSTTAQLLDESCANLPRVAGCHGGYSHGAVSSRGLQSTQPLTPVHTSHTATHTHTHKHTCCLQPASPLAALCFATSLPPFRS